MSNRVSAISSDKLWAQAGSLIRYLRKAPACVSVLMAQQVAKKLQLSSEPVVEVVEVAD